MKAQVEELLSLSKEEAIDLLCKGLNKGHCDPCTCTPIRPRPS